jgi:phosphate transport system permease protein
MTERETMTPPRREPEESSAQHPLGVPEHLSAADLAKELGADADAASAGSGPVVADAAEPPTVIGSTQPTAIGVPDGPPVAGAGLATDKNRIGDRVFSWLATGAGVFTIILIGLIGAFLLAKAIPAIADDKVNFLTSRDWSVDGDTLRFGIVDLLWTTVLISLIAMILAVPVAIGIALFITQYAPKRLAQPVGYLVDLLAAIPSIIYGIWGILILAPQLTDVQHGISDILGWIPMFKTLGLATGTVFDGGVVLAIMILPIVTAVSRDVFERTPRQNIEAAWALGATRWEMIRLAVLPYGRPGVISGAMLGLGRALGETIAITLILSKAADGSPFQSSIFAGGETFASKIANAAAEFTSPKQTGAYIAAGLVLFILTFAVNAAARVIVNRRKEFS